MFATLRDFYSFWFSLPFNVCLIFCVVLPGLFAEALFVIDKLNKHK